MQIRNKLASYFTVTSSLLMLLIMIFIYLLFSNLARNNFYHALHERTEVAAQLYLEADEISESALQKIKKEFVISLPQEVIRMYDSTDELSFIKDTGQNWSKSTINEVRQKKYLAYRENERQVVGIYYEDNQGNFVILASAVDVEGKAQKKNLLEIMAVLFVLQILIQFLAGRWFAQRALHPVQLVNEQVQKISATDLHLRVVTNNDTDEFGILAANFNSLLQRLEKSFDMQKMFVANASHELKTPLTNIIGEVEVAVSKDRSNSDYKKTLQSVQVETNRLNEIIGNFLSLANAENNMTLPQTELVRLDEMLWEIRDTFTRYPGAVLNIQLNALPGEDKLLYIKTNKAILVLAVSNIVQNAIKFSSGQPVTIGLHCTEDAVTISISDKGIGMDSTTLQNIFEPFFRSSGAISYPGHGIGLYIAREMVQLLGGTVNVTSQPGVGSMFNIVFKQNTTF